MLTASPKPKPIISASAPSAGHSSTCATSTKCWRMCTTRKVRLARDQSRRRARVRCGKPGSRRDDQALLPLLLEAWLPRAARTVSPTDDEDGRRDLTLLRTYRPVRIEVLLRVVPGVA
jgi:hypothetical protein